MAKTSILNLEDGWDAPIKPSEMSEYQTILKGYSPDQEVSMPRLKVTPADMWFSKCIREAADWTCECCGNKYEEGSMGLHCSHYFGRRAKSLRFCPDNAFAHCFGCHQRLGSNPDDFQRWMVDKVGEGMMEILREKRNDIGLAKSINKDLKGVAKHYREEHKRLKALREQGKVGILDVLEY